MKLPSSLRPGPLALGLALLSLAVASRAEYLWLQREGPVVEARFGDLGRDVRPTGGLLAPRIFLADGKDLPLKAEPRRLVAGAPATAGDVRAVGRRIDEVNGKRVLYHHQARFGRTGTQAVNDLELVPGEPGGNTFRLMWKGRAVSASQVSVDTSSGWRRVLRPATDGTVTLDTPFPGLYVLEVTARVDGASKVDGETFEDVRHTATLSFEVAR